MTKLVVLSDNRSGDSNLCTEHGLSVFLESENGKFLLDTGASDVFIKNATSMGLNLSDVSFVFLSHGHKDHTGGLKNFLQLNSKAQVVLSDEIMSTKYYSNRRAGVINDISADYSGFDLSRFIPVTGWHSINPKNHCFHLNALDYSTPKGNKHLYKGNVLDDFNAELVFVSEFQDGLFVFTGCAHLGVLNILKAVESKFHKRVSIALGGFHLIDGEEYETEDELMEISRQMKSDFPNVKLYTGHCTGDKAFEILKRELGDQLHSFYSGFEFVF